MKLFKNSHYDVGCLNSMIKGAENRKNPLIIEFTNKGALNKDHNILVIKFDERWMKTAGLFALINKTICSLYFANRFGFVPVVDKWIGCPYQSDDDSVFNYYFKPVSEISMEEAMNSRNVAFCSEANMNAVLDDCDTEWFNFSESYIDTMASIVSKYLSFNDDIQKKMDDDSERVMGNHKSIMGIHFRGTDYKLNMNGHPIALTPDDYFDVVDSIISENRFDGIFLATDDLNALAAFKNRYGSMIVYYDDVFRASKNVSIVFEQSEDSKDGKRIGYEALRDSYTLSKCNGLLVGYSQVAIFSVIYKRSTGKKYDFFEVICKGINKNDKEWIDEFDYYVK